MTFKHYFIKNNFQTKISKIDLCGTARETGVGVESLARERPIGWDIAHVRDQFPDLLPSSSAQVHC